MIGPQTIPSPNRQRELVYLGAASLFAATVVLAGAVGPAHTRSER